MLLNILQIKHLTNEFKIDMTLVTNTRLAYIISKFLALFNMRIMKLYLLCVYEILLDYYFPL